MKLFSLEYYLLCRRALIPRIPRSFHGSNIHCTTRKVRASGVGGYNIATLFLFVSCSPIMCCQPAPKSDTSQGRINNASDYYRFHTKASCAHSDGHSLIHCIFTSLIDRHSLRCCIFTSLIDRHSLRCCIFTSLIDHHSLRHCISISSIDCHSLRHCVFISSTDRHSLRHCVVYRSSQS